MKLQKIKKISVNDFREMAPNIFDFVRKNHLKVVNHLKFLRITISDSVIVTYCMLHTE